MMMMMIFFTILFEQHMSKYIYTMRRRMRRGMNEEEAKAIHGFCCLMTQFDGMCYYRYVEA
jgi:hypothetical protein